MTDGPTILFDRLIYIDRLTRAGIPDEHARVHADALDEALREAVATRQDVQDARRDLLGEIQGLREELHVLRTDMEHWRGSLEQKIELSARNVTIRLGGMLIVLFTALAAIKFFG